MDLLTDWLQEIGTNAVVLCRSRVSAPWGMRISTQDGIMFHIMTEGSCWLCRSTDPPLRLLKGDLVLVPRGLDHELLDNPNSASIPLDDFLAQPSFPLNGNAMATLICGVYLTDANLIHPMLHALPPVIHLPASTISANPSLTSTLSLLISELDQSALGGKTLIQHLFDSLFIYILRTWTEETAADHPGWISALKDPYLSKALAKIHAEPSHAWTVQSLANEAGLSRAAFARQFAQQLGEPPLGYLTRWRMIVAARLMLNTKASLAEVAEHVGYESEFAFSRAFKRSHGVAPTRYRNAPCPRETNATAKKPIQLF